MSWVGPAPSIPLRDDSDSINIGLVGAWMLSEGAGSIANDWSGGRTNGTFQNFVPANWTPGRFGDKFNFVAAQSQWVNVPNLGPIVAPNRALSISAWVKLTTIPTGIYNIVHKGNLSPAFVFFEAHVLNTGRVEFIVIGGGGTLDQFSNNAFTAGVWTHLVVTYDNSSGGFMYWNGELDSTQGNGSCMTITPDVFAIGNDTVSSGRIMDGVIMNVRYWNRAITANEVRRLYVQPFAGTLLPGRRSFSAPSSFTWQDMQLGQRDPVWGKTEMVGYR